LGLNFLQGYGVVKNLIKAMEYLKMSADLVNSDKMNNYGKGLKKGYLVYIDFTEEMKYFKMSVYCGDYNEINDYGLCNENYI
jgi:TPR repeat protein